MKDLNIDRAWFALPLSARSLVLELASYFGHEDSIETCLPSDATTRAIGDEVARLLSAFRNEYGRIRRDVERLVGMGILSLDGSMLRLHEELSSVEPPSSSAPKSTSASRMRRHRALVKARSVTLVPSPVTPENVTSVVTGDGDDASHVTAARSFEQVKDLHSKRARDGRDASHRMPADLAFGDGARAIAERIGVKQPELTWMAFKAHYLERGTAARDWERVWETWVVREAKWEAAHAPPPQQSAKPMVDLNAPWILAAGATR